MFRRPTGDGGYIPASSTVDPAGAKRARAEATNHLVEAVEMGVDVRHVSARLRELREKNHFTDLLTVSMSRRPARD